MFLYHAKDKCSAFRRTDAIFRLTGRGSAALINGQEAQSPACGDMPTQALAWPLANELWLDVAAMKVKRRLQRND